VQWTDLIICKTRMNSLFTHGMRNQAMNFGLFFETAVACFMSYTPGMGTLLHMFPVKYGCRLFYKFDAILIANSIFFSRFVWWLPAMPFAIIILMYDEVRKYYLRKNPGGFLERETYY
jgi:sodium/potassium-transporting ATPase subunit alpha